MKKMLIVTKNWQSRIWANGSVSIVGTGGSASWYSHLVS